MLNAQFGTPIREGPLDMSEFSGFTITADAIREKEFSYVPSADESFVAVNCREL